MQVLHRLSRRRFITWGAASSAAAVALPAWSAGPPRTIRLVVAQAPGDPADILARALAEPMARPLAQSVVVENRPGAAGALAVAQAAPDALTLLLGDTLALAALPFSSSKPAYDPVEGFTHVMGVAMSPLVLMAHPRAGLNSITDLTAPSGRDARGYGSAGPGSLGHLYGELLRSALGLNLVHVPPRGPSLAAELLAGAMPLGIDHLAPYVTHFASGKLVPLAVTSRQRSPLAPEVPSIEDFGHGRLALDNLLGLCAPARLPTGHLARLTSACQQALAQPEVQKKLAAAGLAQAVVAGSAFAQRIREQAALLAPAVRAAGVRA